MVSVEDLKNFTRVIAYDDDNHGVRIFVNGIFIDDMDNRLEAAVHLVEAGQDAPASIILTADVYLCELEVADEIADKVHDILSDAMALTPEQEVAILNQQYEKI